MKINDSMKQSGSRWISRCASLFLPLTIAACSTGPTIQEFPETASPTQEVALLDADTSAAVANQVNVLAPNNYWEARKSLNEAKKDLSEQKDAKKVLHSAARGRAYLRAANDAAALARSQMQEVVEARQRAMNAGAPVSFSKKFEVAENRMRDVTSDLEKGDQSVVDRRRADLQASFLDLELKAIKEAHLGHARDIIQQAVDENAKEHAPHTLAVAEKNYKDADAYITANRHANSEIKVLAESVNHDANHLLKIVRATKETSKTSPEELALRLESKENQVRDRENKLLAQKQVAQGLEGENAALAQEKFLNDKVNHIRSEFAHNEAEVYRQGDTVAIRLRGLAFPTAQAQLRKKNMPIMAKVERVIKELGDSAVVVEGHTDSTGNKDKNVQLSENRAEAVKNYLIRQAAVNRDKIQAVGYGNQRPVAGNHSQVGRALNRRVDILITPQRAENI